MRSCIIAELIFTQGGGSTFGVITSITLKTIPSPQVMNLNFYITTSAESPHAFDMVAYMLGNFPALADAGVSGYPIIFKAAPNTSDGGRTLVSGMLGKVIMLNTQNATDILAKFEPLFANINMRWPGFSFHTDTKYHPSFYSWYQENYDSSITGHENVMGSRLIDGPALTRNSTATKLAFERFAAGGSATVYIVSGKGVWNAQPRGGGTAVCPAWRKTYVHASKSLGSIRLCPFQESSHMKLTRYLAASLSFAPLNETAKIEAMANTNSFADALRELTPESGAYINEVSWSASLCNLGFVWS
jgi:hypothetical protein